MMRRCFCYAARCKWGQRTWSPTASSGGAAPTNGVSAQEALQIVYRPMPLPQTVEYEEDFGHNLMIHREFVSKRHRDQLSFELGALAYSEVELRRGRQQLAGVMNRERRGVAIGAAGAPGDQLHMQTDVDPDTREVLTARYLFDEKRMQFCDRFQNFLQSRLEGHAAQSSDGGKGGEDKQYLFSLMEACAVIYGCETHAAREVYFRMFLSLDLDSLEAEQEALRHRIAEGKLVRQALEQSEEKDGEGNAVLPVSRGNSSTTLDDDAAFIASIPELSLFEDTPGVDDDGSVKNETHPPALADKEFLPAGVVDDSGSLRNSSHSAIELPEEFEEYAPLYKAYLAHAKGESGIASYDVSTLGSTGITAERRRWRNLMDKIVREEYHTMTETEQMDALILNEQLHTVKFFDLKVGDTVREILQLLQRETGCGSSAHRDEPLGISPHHPERRS
ncbi:hypothetical protein TcYC6_0073120 [Trypanosoma cruzi]|uniref:Uncharacterized protein n=1 Tax=Trypanosoma cruzi (strain CL Brener) TaxID=353153 RepID=Q4DI45_TRYCC|nr:hypothetical protein, conserved [Trypanosoma cruzi]EAN92192.1 hypothetical protein, conserved [Trypanosoma cruzi]KAF8299010.1 hypothetical protein TcYC6_0073120 [Trypanosoma cruzi]|eukprot:XP_814043.1 hypothetical protein [Trypanosoma cruzi strain CL Brener]